MLHQVKALNEKYFEEIRSIRRHLHRHPELSWQEKETAAYISGKLEQYGIPHERHIAEHGIVALIEGQNDSKACFALRADMDALPIQENSKEEYRSCHNQIMHACGHDVHTASLLGTAFILHEMRNQLNGSIKLLFQPSEEKMPSGAEAMVKAAVLKNPDVQGIVAQHVTPELEVGKIGFCNGPFMASADEIYIKVIGKGGHAAAPHKCIDPILISAHLILALQQIVSRHCDPLTPSVLSFGDIHGSGATNIIPDFVEIKGTLRTYDEEWRKKALALIRKIATDCAEGMGGRCEIHIPEGCPFVLNDDALTNRMRSYASAYMGAENIVEMRMRMGAEDFSFYTHHVPACFYRLGTGNQKKGITHNVHTPEFDIDEDALKHASGLMAWMAMNELSH